MSVLLPLSSLCTVQHGLSICEKHQRSEYFIVKVIHKAVSSRKIFLSVAGVSLGQKSELLWCGFWVFVWVFGFLGGGGGGVGVPTELSTQMEYNNFVVSFGYFWKKTQNEIHLDVIYTVTCILPSSLPHLLH